MGYSYLTTVFGLAGLSGIAIGGKLFNLKT